MPPSAPFEEHASEGPPACPDWYVVRTRSRAEKAVATHLTGRGIETFLPTVSLRRRWQDRHRVVQYPLFPGYCFTRIRRRERLQVLSCPLVVGILTFNGELVPVEVQEIESIKTLVKSGIECAPHLSLSEGDRVMVSRGPLKGVVGRLVRRGRRCRLELSITTISQSVSVEVDADDVEKC
jgi:transcription termination/antitermination protein NusG